MSTKDEKESAGPTPETAGNIPAIIPKVVKKIIDGVELEEGELDQISGGTPWRNVGGKLEFPSSARNFLNCPLSRNPWNAHQWVEYERDGDQVHCRCSYCGWTTTLDADSSWYIRK